ncbi:MAG: DUF2330 domain-containing protein [Pseudomonadota bacterium]
MRQANERLRSRVSRPHAFLAALALAAVIAGDAASARACGGGVVSIAEAGLGADAQLIFISVRDNNTTDIVTQIGVPASSHDYGVLLPLPAQPTLDPNPIPSDELTKLARATAPRIIDRGSDSDGCGCPIAGSKSGGAAAPPPPITIGEPVNIGPVTAVILDASAPEPLNAWLAANAFVVPASAAALVSAYAGPGRTLVAVRRNAAAASDAPSSVGVHFTLPGDVRDLPLRFTRVGAAARVAFTVLIVAPESAGPSLPFEAITINDLNAADLRGPGYVEAIFRAVDARQGRAFVAEFSGPAAAIPFGFGPTLTTLIDARGTLTRLSAVFAADKLSSDVSFQTPLGRSIPSTRTLAISGARGGGAPGAVASTGWGTAAGLPLLLGLCAWAAARRRARRR